MSKEIINEIAAIIFVNYYPMAIVVGLYNLFVEKVETARNFNSEATDMTQVDTAAASDVFRHQYERDVELSTFDIEAKIENIQLFETWMYNVLFRNSVITGKVFFAARAWTKQQITEMQHELDVRLAADALSFGHEIFNDYRSSAKIVNYLTHYVETMTKGTLLKAKARLFTLRKEHKLSYDLYVKTMLMVLGELVVRFNADQKLFDKFSEMQASLDSVTGEIGRTDVADICISMEDAIDMKRAAEKIAAQHNVDVEEAFLMIQSQREGEFTDTTWNLDIA